MCEGKRIGENKRKSKIDGKPFSTSHLTIKAAKLFPQRNRNGGESENLVEFWVEDFSIN